MTHTYWIDRRGGSHYHKENCEHIRNNPQYHYEPITRIKPRKHDKHGWGLTRIREGGKYYIACSCLFPKRRTIKSPPKRVTAEALRKKTYHPEVKP